MSETKNSANSSGTPGAAPTPPSVGTRGFHKRKDGGLLTAVTISEAKDGFVDVTFCYADDRQPKTGRIPVADFFWVPEKPVKPAIEPTPARPEPVVPTTVADMSAGPVAESSTRPLPSAEEMSRRGRQIMQERAARTTALATSRTIKFVRGNTRKPQRLKWLWRNRLVADHLNAFSGEPGIGKGMTIVDVAARITTHQDFPDCKNELDGPKDVLFLASEDDMDNTIIPRLIVAGADMSRVHFAEISENISGKVEEGIVCLDRDLPILEAKVRETHDIVLIIPDPIIAFLGDADPNKDKEVRPIYSKMKAFAKRLNIAWLFVNHWNKNQNATSINRTSGAKTMVSAPRATWMFAESPEDPNRYLMMRGKGNLSKKSGPGAAKTLAYRIVSVPFDFQDGRPPDPDGVPKLVWDGETEHTCDDLLQEANDPNKRSNKAEELLGELLATGAKLATDIYRAGDKAKLSPDKMKRARYGLGYVSDKVNERWYWAKSEEDLAALKILIFSPGGGLTLNGANGSSHETGQTGEEPDTDRDLTMIRPWLKRLLGAGPMPIDTVRAAAEDEEFNWESVRHNRVRYGVESYDQKGTTYWRNAA